MGSSVLRLSLVSAVWAILAAATSLGQQTLVSFGAASLTIHPQWSNAAYSQASNGLVFSPSVDMGHTLAGTFATRNWSHPSFQNFGVMMSINGANPDLSFQVELFDPRYELLAKLEGFTAGVGTRLHFVPLKFIEGGCTQLSNVAGLQFTWNAGGPIQATISSMAVQGAAPPIPPRRQQTITFSRPLDQVFRLGKTFTMSASADSGLQVSFVSGDTNVLSISNNVAIIRRAGSVAITATNSGNTDYFPAGAAHTIRITQASQTIPAFLSTNNVPFGTKLTLPNTQSTAQLPVSFRVVSGPASITNNVLTVTGVGTIAVEASQSGNFNYRPARALTNSFTSTKATQSITFSPATNAFKPGGRIPLPALSTAGLPIAYRSSAPAIVAISGTNAVVKAIGSATITATQQGDQHYHAARPVLHTIVVK